MNLDKWLNRWLPHKNGNNKHAYEVRLNLVVHALDPVDAAMKAAILIRSGESISYIVVRGRKRSMVDLSTEPPTVI